MSTTSSYLTNEAILISNSLNADSNTIENKKQQDEDKRKQEHYKQIEISVNIASNILTRYRNLGNTAMRHMMLIDKLYLLLDIGLGALESLDDIPPELKQKIDKLITDTKNDLTDLSNWIMTSHNNTSNILNDNNLLDADIAYSNKKNKIS